MADEVKNEAPCKAETPIEEIKISINIKFDGLKELTELTESLARFREKGLTVRTSI